MRHDRPVTPDRPREPGDGVTAVAEDYLKTIWSAQEWDDAPVTTSALAARLGLAASTVSEQVKRLVDAGLVVPAPYRPVELTDAGRARALRVVRRHRLLETYLVEHLGYGWDQVHEEAEVLEHVVSDLFLERIDGLLGRPVRDPHGDPIPSPEGAYERPEAVPLTDCAAGELVRVVRISACPRVVVSTRSDRPASRPSGDPAVPDSSSTIPVTTSGVAVSTARTSTISQPTRDGRRAVASGRHRLRQPRVTQP